MLHSLSVVIGKVKQSGSSVENRNGITISITLVLRLRKNAVGMAQWEQVNYLISLCCMIIRTTRKCACLNVLNIT